MSSPEIKTPAATVKNDLKPVTSPKETPEDPSINDNLQEQCTIDAVNELHASTVEEQGQAENSAQISATPVDEANQDEIENGSPDNSNKNVSFNPHLPEGEENEVLERLRGDAIGNTLYSERFVISTLLKLREMEEPLANDEHFERDLEGLWDMTIEKDVVLKLLELEVYEIFTQSIINYETDRRLMEILVGIIANMCTVSEKALEQLCRSDMTIEILLQLTSCTYSCVLVQLMRLLAMVYNNLEAARIWNHQIMADKEFFEYFCYILKNSTNQTLLSHALETLNAILAKCATIEESNKNDVHPETAEKNGAILQKMVNSDLVSATVEAFQTFYAEEIVASANNEPDEFADTDTTSESLKKTFLVFLNIHDIILNYTPQVYNDDSELALGTCLNMILKTVSTPNFLLLANIDCLQDVVECLLPIYLTKSTLHNEETAFCMVKLWQLLKAHVDTLPNVIKEPTNDFEADDSDELELNESYKELYDLTKELLNILLKNYKGSSLTNIFKRCEDESALKVFEFYGVKISDFNKDHIDTYCAELETILQSHNQET